MQVSADDASSVVFSVPAEVRVETAAPTAVVEVVADIERPHLAMWGRYQLRHRRCKCESARKCKHNKVFGEIRILFSHLRRAGLKASIEAASRQRLASPHTRSAIVSRSHTVTAEVGVVAALRQSIGEYEPDDSQGLCLSSVPAWVGETLNWVLGCHQVFSRR